MCEDVLKKNSLRIEQFYKLNTAVKEDCTNLWPSKCCPGYLSYNSGGGFADICWLEYQYCVEASK